MVKDPPVLSLALSGLLWGGLSWSIGVEMTAHSLSYGVVAFCCLTLSPLPPKLQHSHRHLGTACHPSVLFSGPWRKESKSGWCYIHCLQDYVLSHKRPITSIHMCACVHIDTPARARAHTPISASTGQCAEQSDFLWKAYPRNHTSHVTGTPAS